MKKLIMIFICLLFVGCFSDNKDNDIEKRVAVTSEALPMVALCNYGGTFKTPQFIYCSIATKRSVYIHYTIDGTEPIRLKSPWMGGGVTISKSCTLKVKAFATDANYINDVSPTRTVNFIINSDYVSENFTYAGNTYKGKTNIGSGDCIENEFKYLKIKEPIARNFECDGYFSLKGDMLDINDGKYMYVAVSKDNTLQSEFYLIEGLNFDKKIWLRYGAGNYTVKIYPCPLVGVSNYNLDPIVSMSPQPSYVTNIFNVTNTRGEIGIFKYPSNFIQSDDILIYNTAQQVLKDNNALNADTETKAIYLHNFIIDKLSYDTISKIPSWRKKQDAISCLTTGKAICEGYTSLYCALLRSQGIATKAISGNNGTHAWNSVLDNTFNMWKYVDITNDDTDRVGIYSYTYFWKADLVAYGDVWYNDREER